VRENLSAGTYLDTRLHRSQHQHLLAALWTTAHLSFPCRGHRGRTSVSICWSPAPN